MRIYDPRVGRFLSVDPLTGKYPELTPYQFASNTPIRDIDIDGKEGGTATGGTEEGSEASNPTTENMTKEEEEGYERIEELKGKLEPPKPPSEEEVNDRNALFNAIKKGIPTTPFEFPQQIRQYFDNAFNVAGLVLGEGNPYNEINSDFPAARYGNTIILTERESDIVDNIVKHNFGPNVGMYQEKPLSSDALRVLSDRLGGVEVAQIYTKTKSGGSYNIVYGLSNKIRLPDAVPGQTPYLISHVHPLSTPKPSKEDIETLQAYQKLQISNGQPVQTSSQIIPRTGPNVKFNTSTPTSN